jgi:hypothetical protein
LYFFWNFHASRNWLLNRRGFVPLTTDRYTGILGGWLDIYLFSFTEIVVFGGFIERTDREVKKEI